MTACPTAASHSSHIVYCKSQPHFLSTSSAQCSVGSEAEALAVPVDAQGNWLPERIDMDSHGEIIRVGLPRALMEGNFTRADRIVLPLHQLKTGRESPRVTTPMRSPLQSVPLFAIEEEVDYIPLELDSGKQSPIANNTLEAPGDHKVSAPLQDLTPESSKAIAMNNACLLLDSGIEIRSYSLSSACECTTEELQTRSVSILSAPIPYNPKVDLVAADLKVTPAVVAAIDRVWASPTSLGNVTIYFNINNNNNDYINNNNNMNSNSTATATAAIA